MLEEPQLSVGILSGKDVSITLDGDFTGEGGALVSAGSYQARADGDSIILEGNGTTCSSPRQLCLTPRSPAASFVLHAVTIGIQFHWQRKQDQRFKGMLKLLVLADGLAVLNVLPIEEYLKSVISSEMSARSSLGFLKAHAVTSRSWLLAQLEKSARLKGGNVRPSSSFEDDHQRIRWYDREDHEHFDVCADDHCQRYQGVTSAYASSVDEAVRATRGMVLRSAGRVCDARFSKACGGISEAFENVWEPVRHDYLVPVLDRAGFAGSLPDLRREHEAEGWIRGIPPALCNTSDRETLSQVLVQFDQETPDFFRWKAEFRQAVLARLVHEKSGIDFGEIRELVPLERGASGRLIRLKIAGTRKTLIIGKELEIRRTLSATHLYSAAFVVDALDVDRGIPQRFVLTGAGWGHGVGLCQIGAAVMGERGFSYEQILQHYFKGAELTRWYS